MDIKSYDQNKCDDQTDKETAFRIPPKGQRSPFFVLLQIVPSAGHPETATRFGNTPYYASNIESIIVNSAVPQEIAMLVPWLFGIARCFFSGRVT